MTQIKQGDFSQKVLNDLCDIKKDLYELKNEFKSHEEKTFVSIQEIKELFSKSFISGKKKTNVKNNLNNNNSSSSFPASPFIWFKGLCAENDGKNSNELFIKYGGDGILDKIKEQSEKLEKSERKFTKPIFRDINAFWDIIKTNKNILSKIEEDYKTAKQNQ